MESIGIIESVAGKVAPGPIPSFMEVHILKALEVIGSRRKTIGRIKLSGILGLGEGVTRTLLRHLRNKGLIKISKSGITLSDLGVKVLSEIRSVMSREIILPESPITIGPSNVAVLVRGVSNLIKYGVEQRDAAIKVGAMGATTLIYRHGVLVAPGLGDELIREAEETCRIIISKLRPEEGDVIIIGSAADLRTAEFGAKTAALELLKARLKRKGT